MIETLRRQQGTAPPPEGNGHGYGPVASPLREPLVARPKELGQVTEDIARLVGQKPGKAWWMAFLFSAALLAIGVFAIGYEFYLGIGAWGLNHTIGWGFDITNFVFWVGIGHAGTLISAVLFLFRQRWRTSINRAAEAMTIFAVMCAATFPLIHMGRPWYFYWILPYPNNRGSLWVNFRSPLLWDFFAISTYFTISLVFWYIGMIPDLATLRDRAKSRFQRAIFGTLCHGWNGSARVWHRYETIYALLALLATPLVVSVHSIVSFDFATSVVPGWHATIFPPYFVIGAIFGGFAMVLGLLLITRKALRLEDYITPQHLNWMCKVLLLCSQIMGFAYGIEFFTAWYSGNPYEMHAFVNRATGLYGWAYWTMVACNVVVPQMLWFRKARRTPWMMFLACVSVTIGMWFERFVIIVTSLQQDFLPSSWATYTPTWNEVAILVGMFGLFFSAFLLFTRVLPVISITEVKGVLRFARNRSHGPDSPTDHHQDTEAPGASKGVAGQDLHEDTRTPRHGGARGGEEVGSAPVALRAPSVLATGRGRRARGAAAAASQRYCIGYFQGEDALVAATKEAKRRGYPVVDAFAPHAVHGLPEALGLGPSRLTWIGFWAGAVGLALGLTLQVWTNDVDWPLRVGGQPFNSWPVFIPVSFELTVLLAGLIGVGALFARTRMWPGRRAPVLRGVTDDRFALALMEADASVPLEEMVGLMRRYGALEVQEGDELS